MTRPGRRFDVESGVAPVQLTVPETECVDIISLDCDMSACSRELEIRNTLTGLVAIGMAPWDAMISMIDSGLAVQSDFIELDGMPAGVLSVYDNWSIVVEVLNEFSARNPVLANKCLNAWLKGRTIEDSINLSGYNWLTSLPDGMHLDALLLIDCKQLKCLPRGLVVKDWLDIEGCVLINCIPHDIKAVSIDARRCLSLVELSDNITLDSLNLQSCTALTELPSGLCVDNLDISFSSVDLIPVDAKIKNIVANNGKLEYLPNDLHLEDNLDVAGSEFLISLPCGLRIGGDLDICSCVNWDGNMPADIFINGYIYSDGNKNGLTLREWRESFPNGELGD